METPLYELEDKTIKQYQGSILQLQELLHLKFNVATEILLRVSVILLTLLDFEPEFLSCIIVPYCYSLKH